jgi:amino acid adenylation domain-containing protein
VRFPVSPSQQRLWFLDQLDPGEPTYNMAYAMWLDGPLDAHALQQAMDTMVARHAVLRTSIVAFDGVPEQIVADSGTVPIERIELPAALDGDERTRQAESIAADHARQTFDLTAGPLIRATLVGAGAGRHLLVLVMHHIISDGASAKILAGELSAAYRAETTGAPASLPPLSMEYGDYAVWQHDLLRGEELGRQLAYWREQLRGAPEVLTLPTDRPRPARQSPRGAAAQVSIGAATTRRLAEVAEGANATMFMLFLTGFAVVLSRYARQRDVVIGTQLAGRTHTELDPILGLFTNIVPLHLSLADDPTFAGLLGRVRDATVDALSHQQLPFEKLVGEFAPDRTLAHAPLVQVQFLHGSLTPPVLDLPDITARSRALLTGTAKLDLTLYADAVDGQATLTLEYSTDLFDPPWADQFLRCMAHLLEHAADAPGTVVADLPMLSATERNALIIGRNRQPSPVGPGGLSGSSSRASTAAGDDESLDLWSLLRASTSRVLDGRESVQVKELCDRAAQLGRVLADRGVGPDTLVGLCVERGIGMLTALLAVWWAGGAYVPLDPGFPPARLTAMTRDAQLGIVISDGTHHDLARTVADGATVICVDDPLEAATAPLDPALRPPSALAYVLFVSGSTGRPKGVGVEHGGVANLLTWARRALGVGSGDRFVAITMPSFDIALLELLLPPLCGADLVIATADEAREPGRLRSLIEQAGVTAMQATPETWRMLQAAGGVPACVQLRISGSEPLTRDLADQLSPPGAILWNIYGVTETTLYSAGGIVPDGTGPVEIGPPIDHTRVYILDERLTPVPAGVVGEVYLAGRGVGRGYIDRPQLTAQSFRPDPWSADPGARMYRTGDLGRWRQDAGLELMGRTDHQVKIRGFRIECGEIEAVLRAHHDIRQAAVIVALRGEEPALVAYIVPRRGSAAEQPGTDLLAELRPHLRAALPDDMIPGLIVALPALALTRTAKVDRAALPAPTWEIMPDRAGHVDPRNPVEATLARIWGDLLAAPEPVGVHDNLFALGSHSLTMTRFVTRVADTYGVSLPVHQVYSAPTVGELAEMVSTHPDFGLAAGSSRDAELDMLSDEELDALLRAALAERNRRQAKASDPDW